MTKDETLQLALNALELAKNSHGIMLLSDPPKDAWKTRQVDSALLNAINAIKETLTEETV